MLGSILRWFVFARLFRSDVRFLIAYLVVAECIPHCAAYR
jgi:hypothetical protein